MSAMGNYSRMSLIKRPQENPQTSVRQIHVAIARPTYVEHRQTHPACMCPTSSTSHMITPFRLLYRCLALGTVFDSLFLLVALKSHVTTGVQVLVFGAAHGAVLAVARRADDLARVRELASSVCR